MPEKVDCCGLFAALSKISSVALCVPTAFGVNATLSVQFVLRGIVTGIAPQVPLPFRTYSAGSDEIAFDMISELVAPVFLTVRFFVTVWPTGTLPNASDAVTDIEVVGVEVGVVAKVAVGLPVGRGVKVGEAVGVRVAVAVAVGGFAVALTVAVGVSVAVGVGVAVAVALTVGVAVEVRVPVVVAVAVAVRVGVAVAVAVRVGVAVAVTVGVAVGMGAEASASTIPELRSSATEQVMLCAISVPCVPCPRSATA